MTDREALNVLRALAAADPCPWAKPGARVTYQAWAAAGDADPYYAVTCRRRGRVYVRLARGRHAHARFRQSYAAAAFATLFTPCPPP